MTTTEQRDYRFQLCRRDGTTPVDQPVVVEVKAPDSHRATAMALKANPGHEVVSWGLVEEIEAYEARPW